MSTAVPIQLETGYQRTLKAGSVWRLAGHLPQGSVYAPVDSVLTIEGRQVHEAWLVVCEGTLLGFYLPGESAYSPLTRPIALPQGVNQ